MASFKKDHPFSKKSSDSKLVQGLIFSRMNNILIAVVSLCVGVEFVSAATNKVVCYHGIWSTYRSGNGKFTVEDIDPALCTHLIYSFIGIVEDGSIKHLESNLDINQENIKRFNALKKKNKNLKTLIAIGGWNEGSEKFSAVAASSTKRANFIQSALSLVQTYEFDGFDLDWEYPAQRGGSSADKQNFATLIKEFRTAFDKHGLLLTAAVAATSGSVDLSYDVPSLSKYLDLINVMAYDLHGSWDGVTGQNAPLYPSSVDVTDYQKLLTVDAAVRGWISRGADPQKIALGLGAYGRSYTLANSNSNKVGAAAIGAGTRGPYTLEAGMLGYNEIVQLQKEGGWTTIWDDKQKNPYMYKGDQWVGFDNPKSIGIKVEYAKSLNLGGVMIWSIETDDFRGVSGTTYPILKAINEAIGGTTSGNSNTDSETADKTDIDSVAGADGEQNTDTGEVCTKEGYARDPVDCSIFYYCLFHNGAFVPLELKCNIGLVFDVETMSCDYPSAVQC